MALASLWQGPEPAGTDPIRPLLAVYAPHLRPAALAALFPEFTVTRGRGRLSTVAVWAGGRGVDRAQARSAALGIPLLQLGHGLLRAPPQPANKAPVLSVTALAIEGPGSGADALSVDRVLSTRGWETPALLRRAAAARRGLVTARVGGDWWCGRELPPGPERTYVVIENGRPASAIAAMLAAALARRPPEEIVLVAPAQTLASGLFATMGARGCTLVSAPVDPWQVVERARRVYTTGGEIGFIALLAGREVCCFGDAFYAGWGVTADAETGPRRPFRRTVDEIFAGACLLASRCLDPYHDTAARFEDVAAILADWRHIEESNRTIAACVGISLWKRRRVAEFVRSTSGAPVFCPTAQGVLAAAKARPGTAIAAWSSRLPEGLAEAAARQGTPLVRVEDGFIRSVGLGSDFMPAASLVLDWAGMYYDPRQCSDLERLLHETEFSPALTARAGDLIARLVDAGITKYNLGSPAPALDCPTGRRRILVAGQVEDDLSLRLGGAGIDGNRDLLARVRAANRDAFVIYKPHPDVEAGHRKGSVPEALAREFADVVVRGVSTAALLATVDELHTITSLTGFEALLRRCRVVVYGRPFYAGWGLTTDLAAIDRGRSLALEELVAGALILYPRYLDPVTRLPCSPEIAIERLRNPELWRPGLLVIARRLQGRLLRQWNALAQTGRNPRQ